MVAPHIDGEVWKAAVSGHDGRNTLLSVGAISQWIGMHQRPAMHSVGVLFGQ